MTPTREIKDLARRIAAELVLLPVEQRGTTTYSEEYLQETSRCFTWPTLRCANCNCEKSEEDGGE